MSFFGKKAPREPEQKASLIIGTGGKIDEIVKSLIESANDPDKDVRQNIFQSLMDISKKQPELVLSSSMSFIKNEGKGKKDHIIILLNLTVQMLENELYNISEQLAINLIQMALAEMTREKKEVIPEWQGPASIILVSISKRFPKPVWTVLTDLFPPGSIPHYFIMKTLGEVTMANAVNIVPNLKEIMARTLPVLGQIKKDNLRWVFAAAFGNWCEGVLVYIANKEKAVDKSISEETFSSEIFPAFEIMFNGWMKSGESKVRIATLHAVGQMCALMPREQFESNIHKILPLFLSMYKKEKDHLPITHALVSILEVGTRGSTVLEPYLNAVLTVIHPLFCTTLAAAPPDDKENALITKNINEFLRCFEVMASSFPEIIASYLLARLDIVKVKSPEIRAGTLHIVRHLIMRIDDKLQEKKELLLSGVRPLIENESVLEVKKYLCQVVIAMASQEYLQLEGGTRLIEFIVKQSSITDREVEAFELNAKKAKKPVDFTPGKLRTMCDNILHLATTTVPSMENVLYPFLIEFLVSPVYTDALHSVCRSLGYIAMQKRENEAEDYHIDLDKEVNLPKASEIIVRLLVMLNEPLRRGQLGTRILQCLQGIGPILKPSVSDMWDSAMPKLSSYIEHNGDTESWDPNTWEDLTLRLLSETLKIANDEEWTQLLGENLSQQLDYYKGLPNLKKCALKHLGLILQKLNRKEFIREKLDMIFNVIDHKNELERKGCAQAFGFCSAAHMDLVLDKVKAICTGGVGQKKGGLFSGGGGKGLGPAENTIFLCLGYISSYAPPKLVISRLDSHILHTLEPFFDAKVMTNERKENLIQTIDLFAKALHPSHVQEDYTFRKRDDFITLLIKYMTGAKDVSNQVRVLGFNTCSTLIHLQPPMPFDLEGKLISSTMKSFYELDPKGNEQVIEELSTNFNEMLGAMLYMDSTTVCFGRIFEIISVFINAAVAHQRSRAIFSILNLLKKFLEFKANEETAENNNEESFASLGKIIGILIPRLTDPDPTIRMSTLESIELLFFCDHMLRTSYGQEQYNLTPPKELAASPELRGRLEVADTHEQFLIVHQIALIAARLIPKPELPSFLVHAFKGLLDPNPSSSSGTCVMINGIMKIRGEELGNQVESLVGGLLKAMETIKDEKTMNGTLHSLRTLATHHLLPVIEQLLNSPLPHAQNVIRSLQVIAKDGNLNTQMIDFLTDILNNSQILEDQSSNNKTIYDHKPRAMSATAALGEIFDLEELEDVIKENYAQILCTLLLRFGTTRWGKTPVAADQILVTFKNFLTCIKNEKIKAKLEKNDGWKKLTTNDEFHYAITTIVRTVCKENPESLESYFEFILPYLQGNFIGQRIVTAAVFAEMISHVQNNRVLLQNLINNLLTVMADEKLRLMALKGLGNLADAGEDEVNRFATTAIDALMCSIDSQDEIMAMEAMNGLARIFELVNEDSVAPILVNICHRIRPAFEKNHEDIRAASFQLFGTLHRFGNNAGAMVFFEQIHNNLPSLLMHINDINETVRNNCKKSLRNFGLLLKVPAILEFFNEQLIEKNEDFKFEEFLNQFSVLLITYYPERLNYYIMSCIEFFKSQWNELRCGAAWFIGYAMGNVPPEKKLSVNLNPAIISSAMIGLLKQKPPEVRSAGAKGMSFLYSY